MTVKNERLSSNIHKELSYIIANEVKNPHVKYVTITAVEVTSDLSYARVYFTTMKDRKETLKGLISAKGYIKHELGERIELRNIPELEFIYDDSIEYANNIEEVIKEIHEKDSTN